MNIRGAFCGALLAAMCGPFTGAGAVAVFAACVVFCSLAAARIDRRRGVKS